jgi:hypothetical protein
MPLVSYLRRAGVAAVPDEPADGGTLGFLADQYHRYLVSERAVTAPVAGQYTRLAREFLAACGCCRSFRVSVAASLPVSVCMV